MQHLLDCQSNPQVTKIQLWVTGTWVHSTCECWNCGGFTCVQVMNCNCLALVFKIVNNTLHQDIKWSSQKNIVCGISHDMELEVQHDLADLYWNVSH